MKTPKESAVILTELPKQQSFRFGMVIALISTKKHTNENIFKTIINSFSSCGVGKYIARNYSK